MSTKNVRPMPAATSVRHSALMRLPTEPSVSKGMSDMLSTQLSRINRYRDHGNVRISHLRGEWKT